jgi:nucleoside-diphosphate-sugar epimerase
LTVAAVAAGHEVVCASRGSSPPPTGARHVRLDRRTDDPAEALAREGEFDAVVDVAHRPSWVRSAVAAVPDAHWVFVSTISVYADHTRPGGTPESLPVVPAITADRDLAEDPEAYGGMKVACEDAVRNGASSWTVVRPGLIVGPGDPSGRFTYWVERLAEPGPSLVPAGAGQVQVVDVRDLGRLLLRCAEGRVAGTLDGVGPPRDWETFLDEVASGVSPDRSPEVVPVGSARLVELGVADWAGPGSLPMWLGDPAYAGMMTHDPRPAAAAGLVCRPIPVTARDTLAWVRSARDPARTGLTREQERGLLSRLAG